MRKFLLRLIAFTEIVGALLAFAVFTVELVQASRAISRAAVDPQIDAIASKGMFALCLIVLIVVVVTGLNFVAGILLWKLRRRGLKLSAWAQAALIPQIVSSALSYKFILGPALIIFLQTQTGFAGSTQAITLETVVGSGGNEPTTIGINLLALAALIYLWRLLRRTDAKAAEIPLQAAPDPNRRPLPVRILRFVLKTFAVLATIVIVPVFAWWIWNRIDEAPTPQAMHWFAPLPHTAPDAENAWLYLLGIGAAENEDPIALGKRIVAAHDAREAKSPREEPDAAENALRKGALPYVSKDENGKTIDSACPSVVYRDCLQGSLEASAGLDELAQVNAIRLKRYETALGMPRFEEFATPSPNDPIAEYGDVNRLYRTLIQRDLANPSHRAAALQRLTRAVVFWRRVDEQANLEVDKILAERFLDSYADVLDAGINHWGNAVLNDQAYLDAIGLALRPPSPAQRDYELPWRGYAQRFAHQMRVAAPGTIDLLRHCTQNCLNTWLIAQAFAPQATANLEAQFLDLLREASTADPRGADAVAHRISALWEHNMPLSEKTRQIENAGPLLHALAHNFAGRIFVLISQPAYAEYVNRRHDNEAHLRLLRVKIMALQQHIAPKNMPAFLAAQPDDLRDPYTGEPFEWNAGFSELRSTAKSKREKPYIAVAYLAPETPAVAACLEPVTIVVRVGAHDAKQTTAGQTKSADAPPSEISFVSCAVGVRNATPGLPRLTPDGRRTPSDVRTVTIARNADKLDVRLALVDSKGYWRGVETAAMPFGQRTVAAARSDSDLRVEIEAIPLKREGLFRVDAHGVPARQLAAELAKAGKIKLRNLDAWCDTPVALQAEGIQAPDLLEQLADASGGAPKDNQPSSCR